MPNLKMRIQKVTAVDFLNGCALANLIDIWLRDREPGFPIQRLLSSVAPEGLSKRPRGKTEYRAFVELISISVIKEHLRPIRQPVFDPDAYNTKGYLLFSVIGTDGFALQLTGFKLKEL